MNRPLVCIKVLPVPSSPALSIDPSNVTTLPSLPKAPSHSNSLNAPLDSDLPNAPRTWKDSSRSLESTIPVAISPASNEDSDSAAFKAAVQGNSPTTPNITRESTHSSTLARQQQQAGVFSGLQRIAARPMPLARYRSSIS